MLQTKKVHKPTHEVTLLLADANMAFMQGDHAQAIEGFKEVIKHDQQIPSAWNTLATCYEVLGQTKKARFIRTGALHHDGDADEWKDLAAAYR